MKNLIFCVLLAASLQGCRKPLIAELIPPLSDMRTGSIQSFIIPKGAHHSTGLYWKWVDAVSLHFAVRFDSSAIYTTANPVNQYDINKLYGFSDNNAHHHQFSARFGWRWSDKALRLFAYVYNNGNRVETELGVIPIGTWANCRIVVQKDNYVFTLNGIDTVMPRASNTARGKGYLLLPYFGGDESAPQDIRIELKNFDA